MDTQLLDVQSSLERIQLELFVRDTRRYDVTSTLLLTLFCKYGEIFTLKMFGNNFTCLVGPEAHTLFFKTDDDDLSQKEAYKWMIPVFGPGVVFDCPPSLMKEQMKFMKTGLGAEKLRSVPKLFIYFIDHLLLFS
jgi:cytochrome P450